VRIRAPDQRFALSSDKTFRNRTNDLSYPAAAQPVAFPARGRISRAAARPVLALLAAALAVFAFAPVAAAPASASTTPHRLTALRWAEHHAAGKWYCYGGAGPSCYDCSGMVYRAYAHAGIHLPRTTSGMLSSRRLHRVSARDRQRGDLAFYGSGHVELVTNRGTFGAASSGTRVGWHHPSRWWHPTMYFRVR
jgi:peptidoglycan DL-endopeptidase CwlO